MKENTMFKELKSFWSLCRATRNHIKTQNRLYIYDIKDTFKNNQPQMYEDITAEDCLVGFFI